MNMKSINILFFIVFLFSCTHKPEPKNIIAFSCLKCSGCVENSLNYIREKNIDRRYKIILDSNCLKDNMAILNKIKFDQMSNDDIQEKFGRFGNFILIDSSGQKIEFMTDMSLSSYIK